MSKMLFELIKDGNIHGVENILRSNEMHDIGGKLFNYFNEYPEYFFSPLYIAVMYGQEEIV